MPLPKHNEIRLPALKLLKAKGEIKLGQFIQPLREHFKLSDEDLNEMYKSGNGPIFYDRISWALSYLNMGGLVDKPKRGTYKINTKGIELIEKPEQIDTYMSSPTQWWSGFLLKIFGFILYFSFKKVNGDFLPSAESFFEQL